MVSNVGLKLPIVIDPNLNWKTSSRRRQSAVRRPRTSFTFGSRKRSAAKSLKEAGDLIDKEPKRAGEVPVSESEKLGVSILGRHFSGTLEFVPVKKKRVHLVHSPLSPFELSSHLDELGREKFITNGNTNIKERNEKLTQLPDFSGISLLAAVACDSIMMDGIMNTEVSVSKTHSTEGGISRSAESRCLSEEKGEHLFSTSEDLVIKSNTVNRVESSFHDDRLHWDLNTVMDFWESPHEAVNANSSDTDVICEDGICDDKLENTEPCPDQVVLSGATLAPELVDSRAHSSCIPKDDCALEGSVVAYDDKEKECVSICRVDDSTLEEHQMEDAPVAKIDIDEELLDSPFLVRDACGPERGSLVNVSTSKLEETDAYHLCTGSRVKTEISSSLMIPSENADVDLVTHEKNNYSVSVTDLDIHSGCCPLTNVTETSSSLMIPSENADVDLVTHENNYSVSVADLDIHSGCCTLTNVETQAENNTSLHTDSEMGKMDQSSTFRHLAEGASDVLDDENLNATKYDDAVRIGSNFTIYDSTTTMAGVADAPPIDCALSSHETCKSYVDNHANRTDEVDLEDRSDYDFCNVSEASIDHAIGLGKVELLTDDDSQYEDGEFRGSVTIDWGEDEAEDGETEFVDCRSRNVVEDASLHFDNVECKNLGLSEAGNAHFDGIRAGKFERNTKDTLDSGAVSDKVIGQMEVCRGSRHGIVDAGFSTANKYQTATVLDASSESLRRAVGSTLRKNVSSQIERPKSSSMSYGKDRYYVRSIRSDDVTEPDFENGRSFRRGRLSFRLDGRGRGDHLVDSSNHWDSKCYNSLPVSKNAVAAVAAKLENNGFVIAQDGTILKAGRAGSIRRSSNDRDGAFGIPGALQNLRERSPDRHINASRSRTGRYGPGMVRRNHRERYHAVIPYHQSLFRRDRSFSSHRRSLHLSRSHTRSRSRSRTRSPMRTPPRESSDCGITRSPSLRRRSRSPSYIRSEVVRRTLPRESSDRGITKSPSLRRRSRSPSYFRSEAVRKRMRSPQLRPGFKRMVGYIPSARNHTSPPYASRWADERKESLDRYREHEYRISSGRRPPTRGFSQDHKLRPMNSPKRSYLDD